MRWHHTARPSLRFRRSGHARQGSLGRAVARFRAMSSPDALARGLALAFLAGPWTHSGLLERGEKVLGERPRWLAALAREMLAEFATRSSGVGGASESWPRAKAARAARGLRTPVAALRPPSPKPRTATLSELSLGERCSRVVCAFARGEFAPAHGSVRRAAATHVTHPMARKD